MIMKMMKWIMIMMLMTVTVMIMIMVVHAQIQWLVICAQLGYCCHLVDTAGATVDKLLAVLTQD